MRLSLLKYQATLTLSSSSIFFFSKPIALLFIWIFGVVLNSFSYNSFCCIIKLKINSTWNTLSLSQNTLKIWPPSEFTIYPLHYSLISDLIKQHRQNWFHIPKFKFKLVVEILRKKYWKKTYKCLKWHI